MEHGACRSAKRATQSLAAIVDARGLAAAVAGGSAGATRGVTAVSAGARAGQARATAAAPAAGTRAAELTRSSTRARRAGPLHARLSGRAFPVGAASVAAAATRALASRTGTHPALACL